VNIAPMHAVDRLAVSLFMLDRTRLGIFPDGWGDRTTIEVLGRHPAPSDPTPDLDIVWGPKEEHPGCRVRRGSFTSPVAGLLPAVSRVVSLELMEPPGGSDRTVVLMPAWNDHGFETRRKLARLIVARGIATVSFDIPLYGTRRVVAPPPQAIRTVADFALMGHGAVVEGRALVASLARFTRVGVSGYSMGGNLAAFVSAVSPVPVATSPMAASHSPGPVYVEGILSRAVCWEALGGDGARDELGAVLGAVTVLDIDPRPHHAAGLLVGARHDGFVPPAATEALHRHWVGSELRVVDAGHATLIGRRRPQLADAVVESFERLDRLGRR
jgi:hypothetical protein